MEHGYDVPTVHVQCSSKFIERFSTFKLRLHLVYKKFKGDFSYYSLLLCQKLHFRPLGGKLALSVKEVSDERQLFFFIKNLTFG